MATARHEPLAKHADSSGPRCLDRTESGCTLASVHYDIVLFGATAFVGRLIAEYIARHPEGRKLSWAIAGRTPEKLRALRASLVDADPEIIVADTSDPASVDAMVSQARVIVTAAGPYAEYGGDVVVEACVRRGCHYADLSGEYWFQREMIDRFHDEAARAGVKIVVAAGIDSVPSDLGTQFAIEQLDKRGQRAAQVKALFRDYAGSFSAGTNKTLETLAKLPESGDYDATFCRDPYVLAPNADRKLENETITGWDRPTFDPDFKAFGTPFFMAPINARIVRRSLALGGHLPCSYAEGLSLGAGLRAGWLWISRGFGYFVGDPIPLSPKSGQGPPRWLREAGKFRVTLKATSANGKHTAVVEVRGRGDPGYLATSKIVGEVGLCLAVDQEELPQRGGVLTPALAMGPVLRDRLCAAEGNRFMQFTGLTET
ncbi:MAG: saccharopine dehydrogenase [Myxococcales bacterium FL481]|nr:MAG: saccharopine dehydrogenase [Myxococcales bacterium FL481]